MEIDTLSRALHALASDLEAAGAVVSFEAAAHAWIMVGTGTWHGEPPRYLAHPVRHIRVIAPEGARLPADVTRDTSAVAQVLVAALPVYTETVTLPHGPTLRVLSREAVLAQLLAKGGLAIALAGMLLRVANEPPIDPDVVREVLKGARLGDRFQPLLELLAA